MQDNSKEHIKEMLVRLFKDQADEWYYSYNIHLNGVPADLIKEEESKLGVVTYLEWMSDRAGIEEY